MSKIHHRLMRNRRPPEDPRGEVAGTRKGNDARHVDRTRRWWKQHVNRRDRRHVRRALAHQLDTMDKGADR